MVIFIEFEAKPYILFLNMLVKIGQLGQTQNVIQITRYMNHSKIELNSSLRVVSSNQVLQLAKKIERERKDVWKETLKEVFQVSFHQCVIRKPTPKQKNLSKKKWEMKNLINTGTGVPKEGASQQKAEIIILY